MTSTAPFDGIAEAYDGDFTHTALGELLRAQLWRTLEAALPRDGQLLELGCGTGEDALRMARRGAAVTATDLSQQMRDVASHKCHGERVTVRHLDLDAPGGSDVSGPFDGAWSSFGPLNCVEDRAPLWRWLGDQLRPGAPLIFVVMSKWAPWDWLWFGAHGDLRSATRRLRAGASANAGAGREVRVWYPSWRQLRAESADAFELVDVQGLGVLLPISEAGHLVERAPALFRWLAAAEARSAGWPLMRSLGDHYVLHLRRRPV